MKTLEVFFDYACPFCLRGHQTLLELLLEFPDLQIIWCPCEAHPRPERYGPHSDLCIQGMFYAKDAGADLMQYHKLMFEAALGKRINIESVDALAETVDGFLDAEAFKEALQSGKYAAVQLAGNDYAYEENGVWAVPSYRLNGKKLDAAEGIGVTKEQLSAFLHSNI